MKKMGILNQIEEEFLKGASVDKLKEIFNKATVSKVYNKLVKDGLINSKLEKELKKELEKDEAVDSKPVDVEPVDVEPELEEEKEETLDKVIESVIEENVETIEETTNEDEILDNSKKIEALLKEVVGLLEVNANYNINITVRKEK